MRPAFAAPLALIGGILLLAAGPTRAGSIGPPEPEDFIPGAVLYSVEEGLLLLVSSNFELDDFPRGFFPPDTAVVDLDDLTHGTSDAYALTQICVSDPVCREKILGSGRNGRQTLANALLDAFAFGAPDGIPALPPDLPVPEPGTATLLGLGLGALASRSRS